MKIVAINEAGEEVAMKGVAEVVVTFSMPPEGTYTGVAINHLNVALGEPIEVIEGCQTLTFRVVVGVLMKREMH